MKTRYPLIGFTGSAGSGKTTAANYLIKVARYHRVSFAEPIREMLVALGIPQHVLRDPVLKESPHPLLDGKSPRHAMQTLGTQWGRQHISHNLWVMHALRTAVRIMQNGSRAVFDDVRFDNEAEEIVKHGGKIIRLVRAGAGTASKHESENGIDDQWVSLTYTAKKPGVTALQAWLDENVLL